MHRKMEILTILIAITCFAGLYTFAANKTPLERKSYETASFAGGCFWCMQEALDKVEGIVSTRVGYAGGQKENPTYEEVTSGSTGHAESIEVKFDPGVISYRKLLDVYWRNIDPTVKDQQFCDKGSQYRSVIFFHNPEQKQIAEETKLELISSDRFENVFTEIIPASDFYEAEKYHQNYYKKNPVRYKLYKYLCRREHRLNELWGNSVKKNSEEKKL